MMWPTGSAWEFYAEAPRRHQGNDKKETRSGEMATSGGTSAIWSKCFQALGADSPSDAPSPHLLNPNRHHCLTILDTCHSACYNGINYLAFLLSIAI
jgi:hypothetical protein